jgi:hypothetical protein
MSSFIYSQKALLESNAKKDVAKLYKETIIYEKVV